MLEEESNKRLFAALLERTISGTFNQSMHCKIKGHRLMDPHLKRLLSLSGFQLLFLTPDFDQDKYLETRMRINLLPLLLYLFYNYYKQCNHKKSGKSTCTMFMWQSKNNWQIIWSMKCFPCQYIRLCLSTISNYFPSMWITRQSKKEKPSTNGHDGPRAGSNHPGTDGQYLDHQCLLSKDYWSKGKMTRDFHILRYIG